MGSFNEKLPTHTNMRKKEMCSPFLMDSSPASLATKSYRASHLPTGDGKSSKSSEKKKKEEGFNQLNTD